MSIIFSDLYDEIVEAGVADSPAAKLYIEQAIEPYIGCRLDVPAIIDDFRDHFTPSALDCIQSVLDYYDGKNLSTGLANAHIGL